MGWMSSEYTDNVLQMYNDSGVFTYLRATPLLDIVLNSNMMTHMTYKGKYFEEAFTWRPTGSVQAIVRGDEALRPFRQTTTKKYSIETAMIQLESSPVTQREMDQWENTDPSQVAINWTKNSLGGLDHEFSRALEEWIFTGATTSSLISPSEFEGFQTFNGEHVSSTSVYGVSGGFFEFLAPASQTNTIQNLTKAVNIGFYNQYQNSTGFVGGNSQTQLRKVLLECRRRSNDNSVPTFAFMDTDSFTRFQERNDSKLLIVSTNDLSKTETGNDPMKDKILIDQATGLYGFHSENLLRGSFVGTGANGLAYLINPKSMVLFNEGASSDIKGKRKGNYKDQAGKAVTGWETPFQPVPGSEVYMSKKRLEFQMMIRNPAACGVVAGLAL